MKEKAAEQVLRDIEEKWETGMRDRHGSHRAYLDVNALDPKHLITVQEALSTKGINFEVKQTTTGGRRRVISIHADDFNTHIRSPGPTQSRVRQASLDEPPRIPQRFENENIPKEVEKKWQNGSTSDGKAVKFLSSSDLALDAYTFRKLQSILNDSDIKFELRNDPNRGITIVLDTLEHDKLRFVANNNGASWRNNATLLQRSGEPLPSKNPHAHQVLEDTKGLWKTGTDRASGQSIKYMSFSDIADNRAELQRELNRQDIAFEIKKHKTQGKSLVLQQSEWLKLDHTLKTGGQNWRHNISLVERLGKSGLLGAAIAVPVAGAMLLGGASPAEAAEEGYRWGMPFGDAQIEFKNAAEAGLSGDKLGTEHHLNEAFKSATIEGAGWSASIVAAAKTAATAEKGTIMSTLMKAKNLLSITGWGALASAATAIGFDIYDDLSALGPEAEIQKTQLMQDQLIYGLGSPLPDTITIAGQEMELSDALREHPDEVKAAFADHPEATEIVTAYLALEAYKSKWLPQEQEAALSTPVPQEANIPGSPGQKP